MAQLRELWKANEFAEEMVSSVRTQNSSSVTCAFRMDSTAPDLLTNQPLCRPAELRWATSCCNGMKFVRSYRTAQI